MRIRAAEAADAAAVAALAGELGYPTTPEEAAERLAAIARQPGAAAVYVAAAEDGALAGWIHVFAAWRVESAPFAEIGGLVVGERHRGAGAGRRLVAAAETWCRQAGFAELRVRSNVVRGDAHRFYQRLGFARQKEQAVFARRLDP